MALTLVSAPATVAYTKNPVVVVFSSTVKGVHYVVTVNKRGVADPIGKLYGLPYKDEDLAFDISEILDANTEFGLPNFTPDAHWFTVPHGENWINYYIQINEYDIATGDLNAWLTVGLDTQEDEYLLFGIKGGMSMAHIQSTPLFEDNRFLTYHKSTMVTPDMPLTLDFFYVQSDITGCSLNLTVLYTDGSSAELDLETNIFLYQNTMYRIRAGYNDLNVVLVDPTKSVSSYSLKVLTFDNAIITEQSIIVDFSFIRKPAFLMYANSAGGIDYIYTKGAYNVKYSGSSETAERTNISGKQLMSFAHLFEKENEVFTGYRPQRFIELLTDLFTTDFRYELINSNGSMFRKIIVEDKSTLEYSETQNLFAAKINYKYADVNRSFTPDNHA